MTCNKRIVIDVDVGTDDYLAILLLLYAEKIGEAKIEAILCTHGNTGIENVCKNVVRLLQITNRTDIPVYKGAREQLIPPKEKISLFHGEDGFGDLRLAPETDMHIISQTHASIALHEIVVNNPNEISIIAVAPLTNIALAIKLFDDFAPNVKDIWIMGGNHTGVGNITKSAEFNFYTDPEAAHIVLESLTCPIFMLPWEPCLTPVITFSWRYNVLGSKTPALELLTKAEKTIYGAAEYDHWLPCDAFLAAAFINPLKIVNKKNAYHAAIELNGTHTRGQVVLDHLKQNKPNVTVFEDLNGEEFKKLVLNVTELTHKSYINL